MIAGYPAVNTEAVFTLPFCVSCNCSRPRIPPHELPEPSDCAVATLCHKARQGDAGAMFELGFRFTAGEGVEPEAGRAAGWFQAAAEAGDVAGMVRWAFCLDKGLGVSRDPEAARHWYGAASLRGHRWASRRLAGLEAELAT